MKLSQKAIQRMISGQVGSGGGGGSSLDQSMLAGMATQAWVEDGYISKAFWAELFIIHKKVTTVVMDGTTEVSRTVDTSGVFTPNEIPETTSETDEETGYVTTVTTEIASIESKKGFWTNYFLSALGLNGEGGGGGGSTTLAGLLDVAISNPSAGQVLKYRVVSGVGEWYNGNDEGVTSLAWSQITGKPTTIAGYGITDAKIQNGTIILGSNSITPLTSLPVDGYDARYLKLAGGTMTGQIQRASGHYWYDARDYAIIRNTMGGEGDESYHPVFSSNTQNGDWSMGTLGNNDKLYAVYSTGVSTGYKTIEFPTESCTLLGTNTTYVSGGKGYINGVEITTISGSAGSTNRLTGDTPHTAWGRTYWSSGVPQNVSGNIDFSKGDFVMLKDGANNYNLLGVSLSDDTLLIGWGLKDVLTSNTTISAGVDLNIGYGTDANDTTYHKYWAVFHSNGHFTLNASDSTDVFLNVGGATKTTRLYLYKPNAANDTNAVYLEYNPNNAGIHLVGGGFYSDTYVSALGVNSGGGGGGSTTLAGLLDVAISNPSAGQVLKYRVVSGVGEWYNGNDEGVTSLAWSQITGKPTTIAGYGITDAKIQNGTIILGSNSITPLTSLPVNGYDSTYFRLDNVSTLFSALSSTNDTNLSITVGGTTKTVSGLYALRLKSVDIIDNTTGNAYGNLNNLDGSSYSVVTNYHGNGFWSNAPAFGSNYGGAVVIRSTNLSLMGQLAWSAAHDATTYSTQDLWWRARGTGGWKNDWKRIAFRGEDQYIDNNKFIYWKNNASSQTDVLTIGLTSDNDLVIGYGEAALGYNTYLDGNNVYIRYGTSRTPGIVLNSSGNVGIGTSSPSTTAGDSLTVSSSTTYACILYTPNNSFRWSVGANADSFYWYGLTAGTAMTLLNNGNLGIGTTSPSYKLDVDGSIFGNTLNADTNLSSVSGGAIEGFHSIELNSHGSLSSYGGFIDFHYNGSSADYTARFIETNYGLVKLMSKGANGNDQRAALVIGEGYTSSYIQIGDIRLVCDSNHDLRVVMASGAAANLYATGGISALGMSAGTSSIDEMTFGYLNVNNELNFGSSAKIYMDDFFYIDSAAHVSVNGVEFENNNAHANRLYLGNSQYLYVSGGTLYYYNGSSSKVISS